MMVNTINRLSANNAAFNLMNAANARLNLIGFKGNSASLLAMDNQLSCDMLNDSFKYQAYSAMADSDEKLQKENIKRSFSIFA